MVQKAIIKESRRSKIDPLMIVAVIDRESGFHVRKHGTHGEIGLMQVKPRTARWIARRRGIPWTGKQQLEDPAMNIRIGTAYLAMLRDQFRTPELYLTAYNGGPAYLRREMRAGLLPRSFYANRVLVSYQQYSFDFRPPLRQSYRPLSL
jgi:soluble lytic murein transglycosylase